MEDKQSQYDRDLSDLKASNEKLEKDKALLAAKLAIYHDAALSLKSVAITRGIAHEAQPDSPIIQLDRNFNKEMMDVFNELTAKEMALEERANPQELHLNVLKK